MKPLLEGNRALNTSINKHSYYSFIIFIVLFIQFIFYVPNVSSLNFHNSIYYVLSYNDIGFHSRLVLGSIVDVFTAYITNRAVYIIIFIITILFMIFISSLIGNILSKSNNANVEVFVILFCASPVSILYLFNINNFGRLDLFLIFITIVILFCARGKLFWLVPFFCFLAMLLNQNFAIMYMPIVGILLLYEFFKSNYSKKRLFIFIISCLIVIISFVYFKLLAPVLAFDSLAEIKTFLANKTDIQNGEIHIIFEYYIDYLNYYFKDYEYNWLFETAITYGICSLIETAPLIIISIFVWIVSVRNTKNNFKKIVYLMCLLAPVAGLAMFIATDWDRWIPTIFISQFILIFYLVSADDSELMISIHTLNTFFKRHNLLFPIIVIYSASFIFSNVLKLLFNALMKIDYWGIAKNFFT